MADVSPSTTVQWNCVQASSSSHSCFSGACHPTPSGEPFSIKTTRTTAPFVVTLSRDDDVWTRGDHSLIVDYVTYVTSPAPRTHTHTNTYGCARTPFSQYSIQTCTHRHISKCLYVIQKQEHLCPHVHKYLFIYLFLNTKLHTHHPSYMLTN